MLKLAPILILHFSLRSFAASTAIEPVQNHLRGTWSNGAESWIFQDLQPAVTNEITEKMLDDRSRAIQCEVRWQGDLTITICSEKSRQSGFCYNKGRVAKYMLGISWKSIALAPSPSNPASCAGAVAREAAKLGVRARTSLYALALSGTSEIWLTQKHLDRR